MFLRNVNTSSNITLRLGNNKYGPMVNGPCGYYANSMIPAIQKLIDDKDLPVGTTVGYACFDVDSSLLPTLPVINGVQQKYTVDKHIIVVVRFPGKAMPLYYDAGQFMAKTYGNLGGYCGLIDDIEFKRLRDVGALTLRPVNASNIDWEETKDDSIAGESL